MAVECFHGLWFMMHKILVADDWIGTGSAGSGG